MLLFFIAIVEAVIVLGLLGGTRELLRAKRALECQIPLERFIAELSTRLSESRADLIGAEIQAGLQKILHLEGFDRLCWFAIREESAVLEKIYTSKKPDEVWPAPTSLRRGDLPWAMDQLLAGKPVIIRNLSDLPPQAETDRLAMGKHGIKSIALIPCSSGSPAKGVLVAVCFSHQRDWSFALVSQLGVIGNIFANALMRKNAEEAEQESELRFRRFFENAAIGMAVVDPVGHSVITNPALHSMLGYSQQELSSKALLELTHPEDLTETLTLFRELMNGERESFQTEKRYIRKDGGVMWGLMTVSSLSGKHGKPYFFIGMIEDITERKAIDIKLRASQTLLRSTLDSLSAQVAILDEKGTIIAVNARWKEISDQSQPITDKASVGANYLDICASVQGEDAETANQAADAVRKALGGEVSDCPIVYCCSVSARFHWYQMRMARFEEAGLPRVVLSYEDITEVMSTRKQLHEKQEWLSLALESSSTRIWDWNIITDQITWSENKPPAENAEMGERVEDNWTQLLNSIHPLDRESVAKLLQEIVKGPEDVFSAEFRMVQAGGVVRWISARGHILRNESGKAVRLLCVNTDFTELKLAQIELRRLTARLIRAQEEERQRIARELHDDIGQRLSILMVKLESLRHEPGLHRRAIDEEVMNLTKSVDELTTDIHHLSHELHSSKLQHLGLKIALKELCRQMSRRDIIEVEFKADTIDPVPSEVALCIYRVAQEALLNARKHSKARTATVTLNRHNDLLYMHVRDSGVGFDLKAPSEGLGFVNMRERLRMIGGGFFVDSKPGEGTELTTVVYVGAGSMEARAS